MRIRKQQAWRGIRNRMLLFFGGGAALILILISFVSQYGIPFTGFQGAYQIHQEEVLQHLNAIADIKKGEIRHWFEERLTDVRLAAKDPELKRRVIELLERVREHRTLGLRAKALASTVRATPEYAALRTLLRNATEMSREYEGMDVVELETGTVVASTQVERVGADVSDDEEIRNAKVAGVEEQICFRHSQGMGEHMHVVHPVSAGDGRPRAVLVFLISPAEVLTQLNSSGGLGSTGEIILVDMDRFILAPLKYLLPGDQKAVPLSYRLMTKSAELAAWGIDGLVFAKDYRGIQVVAVVRHIRLTLEFGLGMIVKVDEREVLSFNRKALSYHLGVSAVGLALIIGAIYYLSGRISRPIVDLSRTARAVMEGDLDARSAVATGDEVEELARSFNSMIGTLQGWQGDLERKVKERTAQLGESEERLRLALKAASQGLYDLNVRTGEAIVNAEYALMLGYDPAEFNETNAKWIERLHPDDREPVASVYRDYIEGRISEYRVEFRQRTKNGDWKWVLSLGRIVERDSEGRPLRMLGTHTDITERKEAEMALREKERLLSESQRLASIGSWTYRMVDKSIVWSEEIYRIYGVSPATFTPTEEALLHLIHPEDRTAMQAWINSCVEGGAPGDLEFRVIRPDGSVRTIIGRGELHNDRSGPVCIIGTAQDITDRKKAEDELHASQEQLRQAQKMEAVGLLAGGVAHDFNNILSAIVGFGNLALMKMREDDPLRHYIEMILESSQRAAVLTQSLLAFGRKQVMNVALKDLNELVKRFEKMLLRIIREDVELRTVCAGEALYVMADSGQIEQVIMNLVTNARDAMRRGGRLTIETRRISIDEEFVRANGYGAPGDYAVLSVSDTGVGMDEHTKERIFEPFFTTKEQGRGTGLGLSMVYGIVKKHDGFINVYSEPEKGSVFRIYLPLEQAVVVPYGKDEEAPERIPHGSEMVLIAEDDDVLRDFLKKALEHFGYRVIEAVNGRDAVKRFDENRDAVQLVILDGIMPKMNGNEAYDEIRKLRPDVKALFMSGYAEHVFPETADAEQRPELLAKPLSPSHLLRKVRSVLDGGPC